MKLNPIIPKNNAAEILFGLISCNLDLKNKMQKTEKIPVLIKGTMIETRIDASVSCFFFSALATKPATTPASVVLSKQVKIVPNGLTEKK